MTVPHPLGIKNKKIVYDTILKLQKDNIYKNVTPKDINIELKGIILYRTILRQLNSLQDDGSVVKVDRGEYSTKIIIDGRKERELAFQNILSISRDSVKGVLKPSLWSKEISTIPINPLAYSNTIRNIAEDIVKKRMDYNRNKELSVREAEIWMSSLLNNIDVELGSTGEPFRITSRDFGTTLHQEITVAFLGRLLSKEIIDKREGQDVVIFQEATQIIKNVIDLIDWENWRISDSKTEVVIKIKFNPLNFLYNFERLKHYVRRYEGKHVFPESPDIEAIINERDYAEELARKKLEEFNEFKKYMENLLQ